MLPNESHETHTALQATSFEYPEAEAIVAKHIKPNDHAKMVVRTIKEHGHDQILLSNTAEYALPIFIRLVGLTEYFNADNAFAIAAHSHDAIRTKAIVLEEYLKSKNLEHNLVVIGDSMSDMELAEREHAKGYYYRHPGLSVEKNLPANIIPTNDLRSVLDEL